MGEAHPRANLTFAIISSAPLASTLLEAVCNELATRSDCGFTPLVVRDYDKMIEAMRNKDVQIAWAPPIIAIDLEREADATIRLCSRRAGRADYMSVLFVKKGSPIQTLADLKDKRVAWVAKESSAGYVFPRLKLISEGHDPDTLFAEESFRRTHEAVARSVLRGEYDVGATYASFPQGKDTPSTAGWTEAGGAHDDVRILLSAGPIPSDVIAMRSDLPTKQVEGITAALENLGETIRSLINAETFEPPAPGHFDELRKLVALGRARA